VQYFQAGSVDSATSFDCLVDAVLDKPTKKNEKCILIFQKTFCQNLLGQKWTVLSFLCFDEEFSQDSVSLAAIFNFETNLAHVSCEQFTFIAQYKPKLTRIK